MSDWRILSAVIGGVIRHSIADPGQIRRALLDDLWVDLKSFGGATVRPIELSRIRGIDLVQVRKLRQSLQRMEEALGALACVDGEVGACRIADEE